MAVEKFISTRKLAEYLDQETEDRLDEHHVYDIGSYGWVDENTADPQFLGHAMWQVDPPLQHEYHSWNGEAPVRHRPTEEEEILVVSGTDFEGLMRFARMSLGLSLWQQELTEDAPFDDNHYFWLHYLSAMVMLNAASDRLREFFVMAFFRDKIKIYEKKGKKHSWYQTPFSEARDATNESMAELLGKLDSLAEEIYQHRDNRNKMIHEVATKVGKWERELTCQKRQRFDEQKNFGFVGQSPEFKDITANFTEAQELHKVELRKTTEQIISWYKTLIKASSYVFEVENIMRRRKS